MTYCLVFCVRTLFDCHFISLYPGGEVHCVTSFILYFISFIFVSLLFCRAVVAVNVARVFIKSFLCILTSDWSPKFYRIPKVVVNYHALLVQSKSKV